MRAAPLSIVLVALAAAAPAVAQQAGWRVADAQRAAWGRAGTTTIRIDNENVRFTGGQLVPVAGGVVLVAEGRVGNFSHISPGRIGAFYLKRSARGFARGPAFPSAVTGGSMGGLAEWGISRRFSANPVIYAEGGFTGQGLTCTTTSLTELTPRGPVELGRIPTGYEDPNGRSINGKIAAIVAGRSFRVDYTGSMRFSDVYRRGPSGKYQLVGRSRLPQC